MSGAALSPMAFSGGPGEGGHGWAGLASAAAHLGVGLLVMLAMTRDPPPAAPASRPAGLAMEMVFAAPGAQHEPGPAEAAPEAMAESPPPAPAAPLPAFPRPEAVAQTAPPHPGPPPPSARPVPRPALARAAATNRPAATPGHAHARPAHAAAQPPGAAPAGPGPTADPPQPGAAPAAGPPLITAPRFRRPPPPPEYPPRAIELDLTGTVVLRALLNPEGDPREVRIHRSSGQNMLDSAAAAAVRRWAFEPASRDGHRIEAWVEVPVHFRLN